MKIIYNYKQMPFYNELGHDKSIELLKKNKYVVFKMWEYYALMVFAGFFWGTSSLFLPTSNIYVSGSKGILIGLSIGVFFGLSFNTLIYRHILKSGQYTHKNR